MTDAIDGAERRPAKPDPTAVARRAEGRPPEEASSDDPEGSSRDGARGIRGAHRSGGASLPG